MNVLRVYVAYHLVVDLLISFADYLHKLSYKMIYAQLIIVDVPGDSLNNSGPLDLKHSYLLKKRIESKSKNDMLF